LLTLLNERTPVDQFDVTGPFEFQEKVMALEESAPWRSNQT